MVMDVSPYSVTLCLLACPFTTPNNNDPPSRLQTHAVLQSPFMLVDFWRLWCHYGAGWRFDIVPLEFHAPCVSNWLKHSAAGTAEIGVLLPLPRRITSQPRVRDGAAIAARSLFPPWTSEAHFSCHRIWKHVSNPANLWMHNDPGVYHIYSSRGLLKK